MQNIMFDELKPLYNVCIIFKLLEGLTSSQTWLCFRSATNNCFSLSENRNKSVPPKAHDDVLKFLVLSTTQR